MALGRCSSKHCRWVSISSAEILTPCCFRIKKKYAHFKLEGNVEIGPIAEVVDEYDVAIIDMPYNLFTHITPEEQLEILKEARRFTKKVIVVTIETIDHMVEEAGFVITDRCVAKKGHFIRQVLVCE